MLDVREETYPSGGKYSAIYVGETRIGCYEKQNGGYLPWGCRRVLRDEQAAQLKVIQRYVAARLGEARKAAALFSEFGSEV